MKKIYLYESYKDYVNDRLEGMPRRGRGVFAKMASAAQTYSSSISQVFRGDKHLTLEQAAAVADFLSLSDNETRYFLLLVQHARAGSPRLSRLLERELAAIRERENALETRLPAEGRIGDAEAATFYSDWAYSAVRQLSFLPGTQALDAMADRLRLPREKVQEVLNFLLETGLCVEKKGRIQPGPKHTHLPATSRWISRHHANWRLMAMEKHPILSRGSELAYSSPVTLSRRDVLRVRELLAELCEDVRSVVDRSKPEALYCLNLDWFEVRG